MKKKIFLLIIVVLLIQGLQFSVNHPENGVKSFVKYLNLHQQELGVNSYGLLEHSEKIDVKIYLPNNKVEGLKTLIEKYSYTNVKYETKQVQNNHDVVVTVTFAKFVKQDKSESEEPEKTNFTENIKKSKPLERKAKNKLKVLKKKKIKCPRRVKVQVEPVMVKDFNIYKDYELSVIPANKLDVLSKTEGVVLKLPFNSGDLVKAGEVIVNFDLTKINEELSILNAKLKNWKVKLFKREHWKERNPRAEDNAKKIIKDTQALIDAKQEELNLMNLQSQISGKIFYTISSGDFVKKGDIIAKLINNKKMNIIIPTSDAILFNENEKVNLKFENLSELYSGTILTDDNGKIIEINNENEVLKEGIVASFKVVKEVVKDAIVVDSDLLFKENDKFYTFIVDGKRAKKVFVTVKHENKIRKESLIESGLLKEDEIIITNQNCLTDRKKIKVMEINPITGKLVKRKKKKSKGKKKVVRQKTDETKISVKPRISVKQDSVTGNFLKLSFGGGYHYIADSIFSEIYGNGLMSGRFELSYTINDKFELFFASDYISKKGNFIGLKEDVSLKMIPMYFGGKYNFKTDKKFSPFVGLAFTAYAVKEKTSNKETAFITDYGVSLMVGVNMMLKPNFDLFCHIKYDYIQLSVETLEDKLDVSGTSLIIGASYRFKF